MALSESMSSGSGSGDYTLYRGEQELSNQGDDDECSVYQRMARASGDRDGPNKRQNENRLLDVDEREYVELIRTISVRTGLVSVECNHDAQTQKKKALPG